LSLLRQAFRPRGTAYFWSSIADEAIALIREHHANGCLS
jgi:hypothetical protein